MLKRRILTQRASQEHRESPAAGWMCPEVECNWYQSTMARMKRSGRIVGEVEARRSVIVVPRRKDCWRRSESAQSIRPKWVARACRVSRVRSIRL